jgi:hypothetical protein
LARPDFVVANSADAAVYVKVWIGQLGINDDAENARVERA